MLVSFYAKNFRSIHETAGVSLVGMEDEKQKPEHLVHIPGSKLFCLRTGVVYGANASGKSTLCKALRFVQRFVLESRPAASHTGREPFQFFDAPTEPSEFDLRFMSEGHLYRYYVEMDDNKVIRETLLDETEPDGEAVFERMLEADGTTSVDFPEAAGAATGRKMRSLAAIGIPPTQSFVAVVRMLIPREEDRLPLNPVINWFSRLHVISPDSVFRNLERVISDGELNDFVSGKLDDCSTGINAVVSDVIQISEADYLAALHTLPKREQDRLQEANRTRFVIRAGDDVAVYDKVGPSPTKTIVRAQHGAQGQAIGRLSLNQESDGTRRLFNLLPALYSLGHDACVYVIDEIDRSMHPLLTREFVASFLEGVPKGQLLMTTHDNNLLDADLFRRDEVWFSEKDGRQSTHYFSLAEFKPRTLKTQGAYYLEGRFGAIPILRRCRILDRRKDGVS